MSRRSEINAALDAIYAELPEIECKGLCFEECSAISMTPAERQRIRLASGVHIPDRLMDGPSTAVMPPIYRETIEQTPAEYIVGEDYNCPALTAENRCAVYELRPYICRAWGLTRRMHCPHGCRPSRWLSEDDFTDLMYQTWLAGGMPDINVDQGMRMRVPSE